MMDGAVVTGQAKLGGDDGSKAGLVLRGIWLGIGGEALLDGLDLTVLPGEVVTVMGPSGSGKSTLLAYAAGFLDKAFTARGDVLLDGADITTLPVQAAATGNPVSG